MEFQLWKTQITPGWLWMYGSIIAFSNRSRVNKDIAAALPSFEGFQRHILSKFRCVRIHFFFSTTVNMRSVDFTWKSSVGQREKHRSCWQSEELVKIAWVVFLKCCTSVGHKPSVSGIDVFQNYIKKTHHVYKVSAGLSQFILCLLKTKITPNINNL